MRNYVKNMREFAFVERISAIYIMKIYREDNEKRKFEREAYKRKSEKAANSV